MFGSPCIPQRGSRGKKMARLVTRIHCWACIARTLKHLWACIQRNAKISRFCGAKPARCNPRHVGVGGCTRGCGPETSPCFQTRRHNYPHLPSSPLSPLFPTPTGRDHLSSTANRSKTTATTTGATADLHRSASAMAVRPRPLCTFTAFDSG